MCKAELRGMLQREAPTMTNPAGLGEAYALSYSGSAAVAPETVVDPLAELAGVVQPQSSLIPRHCKGSL